MPSERASLTVGIFVGGRGRRLGGVDKGKLRLANGETLAGRLVARCRAAVPDAPLVLVGAADAYAELGLPALADAPPGIGPLGGLRALVLHARAQGHAHALALACDLPYLEAPLVARLATEAPRASLLAPRPGEFWEALVARYAVDALDAVDAAMLAGERALQAVIARLGERAVALDVNEHERAELRDWDEPGDAPG
ncbi:MAG TPA: NTP transferase domain-containing protein [Polyangiaceae bacterium]|nr:NTP transferase domain-containing protein [Polyangiaceae bacterium]